MLIVGRTKAERDRGWKVINDALDASAQAMIAAKGRINRPPTERERQEIELRLKSPVQSKGKPVEDAGFLPLFVAANEPELF